MLGQFLLLKQQDQVPAYLTVRQLKTWLLTGRNFVLEFQKMIGRLETKHLLMAELRPPTLAYPFPLCHLFILRLTNSGGSVDHTDDSIDYGTSVSEPRAEESDEEKGRGDMRQNEMDGVLEEERKKADTGLSGSH
eukprot:superscaffoldBa00000729_g6849